jgi:hypothetical protein
MEKSNLTKIWLRNRVQKQRKKNQSYENGSVAILAKFPFVFSIFVPPEDGRRPKHVAVVIIKTRITIVSKTDTFTHKLQALSRLQTLKLGLNGEHRFITHRCITASRQATVYSPCHPAKHSRPHRPQCEARMNLYILVYTSTCPAIVPVLVAPTPEGDLT